MILCIASALIAKDECLSFLLLVSFLGNGLRDKVGAEGWLDAREDFFDTL